MNPDQLAHLNGVVLIAAGLISVLLGVIMHRTHFCTMGAVSDAILMGSMTRMRQWALALVVAMLGFACLCYNGLISPLQSVYATPSVLWLSTLLGGLMFGWGMVWASGCGAKTLVRMGTGNLKSLIVFVFMGLSALITIKGVLAVPRVYFLDTFDWIPVHGVFVGQWTSQALNLSLPQGVLYAALIVAAPLVYWVCRDREFLNVHNLSTGIAIGLVICGAWLISGVLGHGLEHPETLEEFFLATNSHKMEALSLTAPAAMTMDALLYFSDGTKRWTFGMVSLMGIVLGAFLSGLFSGRLKWESFTSRSDLVRHMLGGILMGVGAVMAMGCSIGQGLSGMSTLSLTSLLATAAMLLGASMALWRDLHAAV
jgi:uncharacterized membrane protein YedE/YeeE